MDHYFGLMDHIKRDMMAQLDMFTLQSFSTNNQTVKSCWIETVWCSYFAETLFTGSPPQKLGFMN